MYAGSGVLGEVDELVDGVVVELLVAHARPLHIRTVQQPQRLPSGQHLIHTRNQTQSAVEQTWHLRRTATSAPGKVVFSVN